MVAAYPESTRSFEPRVDQVDINNAADINALQEEVVAVQKTLGRNPQATSRYSGAATVSNRLTLMEDDLIPRVDTLERRLRRAAVTARRGSPALVNSGAGWQVHACSEVLSEVNDFTDDLYDNMTGRMYSVAPSPGIWSVAASVTFAAQPTPVGTRGLALVTSGGTQLAVVRQQAYADIDQTLFVSWTGRLTADPAFFLETRVQQSQGEAIYMRADSAETPTRTDFTHIPG